MAHMEEQGKPVSLSRAGETQAVRPGDGDAGKGSPSKRMLSCNGTDRGRCPARKGADFGEVSHDEEGGRG